MIGGGLAGCEAAWQAAERGIKVDLYEMRPAISTGAHVSAHLAELVCSNSLGSDIPDRAAGVLKQELGRMGSLLIRLAYETALPAGGALAVDREIFAQKVTAVIEGHPNIRVFRQEITALPETICVVASGPLTSPRLAANIQKITGQDRLFFYDAISPTIAADSIDFKYAFRASRYNKGSLSAGDYLNCPLTEEQYYHFVRELTLAQGIEPKDNEIDILKGVKAGVHEFFEGCLPVEVLATRDPKALAYGPLRPVGLQDPSTGKRFYAVLQLRQDNLADTLYNMVGFQTNLTFSEQRRVFRLIPGLENAIFERYGQMHRNTFIFSPALLEPGLRCHVVPHLFFAGQITGVEGYTGNIATGLLAGWNAARTIQGKPVVELPRTTITGSLCYYVTHASKMDFQPMKANFGLLPEYDFPDRIGRRERGRLLGKRAQEDLELFLSEINDDKTLP